MSGYYPVYLDLRGRRVVVVGGGAVAAKKVAGLVAAGAAVRVIAPELHPALAERVARGEVEQLAREYRDGDLEGAHLAFAERLGEELYRALWREAERRRIFLNVEDETPYCSFIAASLLRRGDLTITVSTAGRAPALAVRIRQELERRYGDHHARFLELAGRLRAPLARRFPDFETRRSLWYRLVDSDVLELLRRGDDAAAHRRFVEILGVEPEPAGVAP